MKKKKNHKKDSGPHEINYRFTPDRMIFEAGGKEFYLSRDRASFLFGRNVEIEFEKANDQDEDFSEFEKIENMAALRFYTRRHIPVHEFSKELGFDLSKYQRWLAHNSKRIENLMTARKLEIEKEVEELEKKHSLPEPEKPKAVDFDDFGMTKKIAKLLNEGMKPREIAAKLKVDYPEFILWFSTKQAQGLLERAREQI